ncbi:PH domain-containing protein DDB_G0275795 [Drosophila mauritiana]|uniref:PH domain-containing protein DDB_G0275795 n=1 Tax=Drosophila mauritiana TaxID=7226 RepID=A0A6P8KJ18_DROMA|nr:PH domain-containing protein DDB_G0275795 [Drosophila mauritiana]
MQRSSYPLRHIVRPSLTGLLGGGWIDLRRTMASDSWGRGDGNSDPNSSKAGVPRASATSTVMSNASSYSRGANTGAFERRINREDNMWRDQSYIDTQWLNPRDPTAYRPNFRPTEPTSLRKQFMRCPDEISREVMGRDWEETVRTYKRNVRSRRSVAHTEERQSADNTRNRQQHLQLLHMQHQQEQQQNQQQQQKKNQQQYNHWGRSVDSPEDQ